MGNCAWATAPLRQRASTDNNARDVKVRDRAGLINLFNVVCITLPPVWFSLNSGIGYALLCPALLLALIWFASYPALFSYAALTGPQNCVPGNLLLVSRTHAPSALTPGEGCASQALFRLVLSKSKPQSCLMSLQQRLMRDIGPPLNSAFPPQEGPNKLPGKRVLQNRISRPGESPRARRLCDAISNSARIQRPIW